MPPKHWMIQCFGGTCSELLLLSEFTISFYGISSVAVSAKTLNNTFVFCKKIILAWEFYRLMYAVPTNLNMVIYKLIVAFLSMNFMWPSNLTLIFEMTH